MIIGLEYQASGSAEFLEIEKAGKRIYLALSGYDGHAFLSKQEAKDLVEVLKEFLL